MTPEERKRAIEIELELRNRQAAGGEAPPEEGFVQETPAAGADYMGRLKKSFPGTTKAVQDYIAKRKAPGYKRDPLEGEINPDIIRVGMAALSDFATYGSRRLGEMGGVSEMEDPEGGIFKPIREDMREHFKTKMAENLKSNMPSLIKWARERSLQIEDVLSNFAVSMLEDPGVLLSGGAAGIKGLQKFVPGAKSTLRQLGGLTEAEGAVERAASKKGLGELKVGAKEEADVMSTQVGQELEQLGAARQKELEDSFVGLTEKKAVTEPFERGKQLTESVGEARAAASKRFASEEERTLGKLSGQKIPTTEATMFEPARSAAADLQKDILTQINYKPNEEIAGYLGGRAFAKEDADVLIRMSDDLKEAKTVDELLAKRRGIDQMISYDEKFENRDFLLKGLRNRVNDVIEQSFYTNIKNPKEAQALATAWRDNNKFYAEISDAMSGIGRKPIVKEDYAKTLDKMGIDNVKKVFETAKKHKELQPVADQVKAGFIDDFLLRSTDVDGRIDFKMAKKVWNNLSENKELLDVVLTKEQQSNVKFALGKFENTELPGRYLGSTEKAISDKLGGIANYDKRYALEELKFLDNIMGRSGTDALSYRAQAMSQAEQLGMSKEGRLPLIGKQVLSRELGTIRSQIRSPWGVVHATRLLNKVGDIPKANLEKVIKVGLASALAGAAVKTAQPEKKKTEKSEEETPEEGKGDVQIGELQIGSDIMSDLAPKKVQRKDVRKAKTSFGLEKPRTRHIVTPVGPGGGFGGGAEITTMQF
jgi:predicted nucleic acid-binding protein